MRIDGFMIFDASTPPDDDDDAEIPVLRVDGETGDTEWFPEPPPK